MADRNPSRRLAAGPFEAMGIDEGSEKPYGMAAGVHPIVGESFGPEPGRLASEKRL
jgi:hypothetical protein